jgi:hypothetical protein
MFPVAPYLEPEVSGGGGVLQEYGFGRFRGPGTRQWDFNLEGEAPYRVEMTQGAVGVLRTQLNHEGSLESRGCFGIWGKVILSHQSLATPPPVLLRPPRLKPITCSINLQSHEPRLCARHTDKHACRAAPHWNFRELVLLVGLVCYHSSISTQKLGVSVFNFSRCFLGWTQR